MIYYVNLAAYTSNDYLHEVHLSTAEAHNMDELASDDLEAINSYSGDQYLKLMHDKFTKNWVLHIGYVDGKLGGAAWVLPDFSEFKTRNMQYIDKSVSIIDCWTIPEHRGKNVYPFLLTRIVEKLRVGALDRVFIEVNERNYASIKGIEKAGFQRFSRIGEP